MDGAHADGVNLGAWPDGRGVDMRSTFWAKRLRPLVSALGGLDVDFRFARKQLETIFAGVHDDAERGTR